MSFGIRKDLRHFMTFTAGADPIAAGGTSFCPIGGTSSDSGTEIQRQLLIPVPILVSNLTVEIGNGQPASGSLVFTLRKNGVDTAMTCTIAANASAGTIATDAVNTVSFTTNDLMSLKVVNNASGNSGGIVGWTLKIL